MELLRRPGIPPLVGIVAGATLSAVVLSLDDIIGPPMDLPPENARALLGATFAALVTVGAFAFWMRPIAAQLAASEVPSRVVVDRLHDGFQRRTISVTVSVLAYEAVTLLALPTSSSSSAPVIATLLGAVLGVGGIAGLLIAMRHAERATRPSILIAEAARQVIARIRQAADLESSPVDPGTTRQPSTTVSAPVTGWVRAVDEVVLQQLMPAGSTVRVDVDVGTFVVADWTTVASMWAPSQAREEIRPAIAACFEIGDERAESADLPGSLSQFVDIGVHAATGASAAPSTVYETMWQLGAILHELCRHELGIADRQVDGGGVLIRRRSAAADLANLAIDRIRQVTASEPPMALELVRVLCDVRSAAMERDRWDIVRILDDQSDRIVDQCRRTNALDADVERVVAARQGGDWSQPSPSRAEEYSGN